MDRNNSYTRINAILRTAYRGSCSGSSNTSSVVVVIVLRSVRCLVRTDRFEMIEMISAIKHAPL